MVKKEYSPFQRAILDSVLEDYKKLMADAPEIAVNIVTENRAGEKRNRRNIIPIGRRVARAVLIGAIIVVLLAASVMAIPALRTRVVEFFLRENSDSYGITFNPEAATTAPTKIEQEYGVTYLPYEFFLNYEQSTDIRIMKMWIDSTGNKLTYWQKIISEWRTDIYFSADAGVEKETALMGDYLVTIITNEGYRELIWTDNAYCYTLEIPTSISWEEVEKIFASWGPKE